jgi:hypothetical protein
MINGIWYEVASRRALFRRIRPDLATVAPIPRQAGGAGSPSSQVSRPVAQEGSPMSAIRRAAVTGLLAAWLAPLPAPPQGCDHDGRGTEPCMTEAQDRGTSGVPAQTKT